MIVRSAARRRRAQVLAASFAQLNLPWLAPAQLRWVASRSNSTRIASQRHRRRLSSRVGPTRQLATAAESHVAHNDHWAQEQIPWNWQTASAPGTTRTPNAILKLPINMEEPSSLLKVQTGVSGSVVDLVTHFHTSIRIGRLERARAIMRKMITVVPSTAPEVLYANTIFFEHLLESLQTQPKESAQAKAIFADMESWLEESVIQFGVEVQPHMLVCLIRAAMHAETVEVRDAKISKYAEMAQSMDEDDQEEVFLSSDYSDEEFFILNPDSEEANISESTLTASEQSAGKPEFEHLPLSSLPEVIPVIQRGFGLTGIRKVFKPLMEHSETDEGLSVEARKARAMARQLQVEENVLEVAIDQWRAADEELKRIGINQVMQTRPIAALMWQWYSALLPALQAELKECQTLGSVKKPAREDDRMWYGPYLELLRPETVAVTSIIYLLNAIIHVKARSEARDAEVKLTILTEGLTNALEAEYRTELASDKRRRKDHRRATLPRVRSDAQRKRDEAIADVDFDVAWPVHVRVKLGAMLVSKLMDSAQIPVTREHPRTGEKITQMQPALLHSTVYIRGKKQGSIRPHEALMAKLLAEPVNSLMAKKMPMLVEPVPWTGWSEGGYYRHKEAIMRITQGDKVTRDYFRAADAQGGLEQIYAGLNSLSKVPWRINRDVLKVQLEAWNSGEAIASLAPLNPDIPLPPEPAPSANPDARRKWLTELRDIENKKASYHSQRCFQNFQLEIARTLVNETIYFPHNLDFRGRAYPIPPYLNHMGADNVRALMVFSDGKELGEEGLRWLKIHLANVAGHDKASLQEREDFTMSHLDDIRDSVRDPLGGNGWWLKAEDAWQCLAACFELVHALDSPEPTKFVSHLPLHQDGTCNGLQHYAALGGDKAGAMHVNLEPGDRPADVYSGVANAVIAEVKQDAANGHSIAKFLDNHITRKVVKQPVMTNVYGVTSFGARAQVRKQLEDLFPDVRRYDAINHREMSGYIADKIFKSLGSMFKGAQAIQIWLGQCADRISTCITPEQISKLIEPKSEPGSEAEASKDQTMKAARNQNSKSRGSESPLFKSTVVWTTPLGLPIAQPYRAVKNTSIHTKMQRISISEPQNWDPVDRRKQLQAFPPNFIHSLDATHMMLSAIKCSEAGLTFASIHDSFWTHACDITRMGQFLREAFVSMHQDNIIGRLREEFVARYQDCMYLTEVPSSSPLRKKIRKWRLEHKKELRLEGEHAELKLEWQRATLLRSSDAVERARGEAMITPASILDTGGYERNAIGGQTAIAIDTLPTQGLSEDIVEDSSQDQEDADALNPRRREKKLTVWRALRFPEVPKKGDFDVARLKESKYFFH